MTPCTWCGAGLDLSHRFHYEIYEPGDEIPSYFCSLDCVMEWTRKLQEHRPKLSKSRVKAKIRAADHIGT